MFSLLILVFLVELILVAAKQKWLLVGVSSVAFLYATKSSIFHTIE
jgi:hypothetical protein